MNDYSQAINELYQCKLSDNTNENIEIDYIQFFKQLQRGFNYHTLDLDRVLFGNNVLSRLGRVLRMVPGVDRLKFYGNLIRDGGIQKVVQLLQTNPQITFLDIGSNELTDESLRHIKEILKKTCITSLQIGSFENTYQQNRFTWEAVEVMMEVIAKRGIMVCFGIGGIGALKQAKMGKAKDFSKYLSKLICRCKKLATLDISRCNLVDSDQAIIAAGFFENNSLKRLDIHENYFPSGAKLVEGICNLDNLVSLNISNCSLSESACLVLSNKMSEGWGLISLNISHNSSIGTSGIAAILSVLADNIYLVSLNISDTGCDASIVPQLSEVFTYNSILQELDISHNAIGDSLAYGFQSLTLHSLSLASCRISDIGAVTICKAIASNHTLKRLSLKNNFLSKGIGYEIVKILQANETLTFIDLTSTQVDCFALEGIQTICTRNKTTVHTNKLARLRKEYIHLSIQDSKIPGVLKHLDELRKKRAVLEEQIENITYEIENVDATTKVTITGVKKEIEEIKKGIEGQEEQIVEIKKNISQVTSDSDKSIAIYKEKIKKEQEEFEKAEADADKIEKETIQINKEGLALQRKLTSEVEMMEELLGNVIKNSRNRKKLKDYEIPVYPYEEEEAAERAAQELKESREREAQLARERELYGDDYLELIPDNNNKKNKKKKKGKAKKKTKGK